MILGIDTGGTFTDFALFCEATQLRTHKVLSTPDAPERAILQGIKEMGLEKPLAAGQLKIIHGSTVATNAALEGKGVKTAFITNRGFKDMLTIGRQTRPQLYRLESPPQTPPVAPSLCLEMSGRIDSNGQIIEEVDSNDLVNLVQQLERLKPKAIAITLLFSFINDAHERLIEDFLQKHLSWSPFICRSSFVLPEYKEYERGIATWLNASLGPLVEDYLLRLKGETEPSPLAIMQSTGGTIDALQASKRSVNLLLSGPAGGLAAARFLAKTLKQPRLITFDMGGTSSDVALISKAEITLTSEGKLGSFPVAVPMVDMHTIGAGGGSIAYVDEGGLLKVGPQSAGAKPGPACYDLDGKSPTVSDANLVLGKLVSEAFLGGSMPLNKVASLQSLEGISTKLALTPEEVAEGIIRIANEHMARALRVISVERGYDPKAFRLCCFGGAGGLHICALADALEMKQALVPMHAGVLSALGMVLAPAERQLSRSYQHPIKNIQLNRLEKIMKNLTDQVITELRLELDSSVKIKTEVSLDLRYLGQSAYLNIPWQDLNESEASFHQLHASRYGHRLSTEVEVVNIRVIAQAKTHDYQWSPLNKVNTARPSSHHELYGYEAKVPLYKRQLLAPSQVIKGPALIAESNATTFLEADWSAAVDESGHLFLQKQKVIS